MIIIAAFFVLEIFLGKGKIMKKIWTKALAYVLAVTMCFSAVNVPVYAQGSTVTEVSTEAETTSEAVTEEATVSGNDAEPTTEEVASTEEATTDGNDGSTWDQVTTENVFEGENYKVTFTLTSNWDAGYNANVKLENTGDSTIQNWYLGFDYNNSITNIWNAEVSSNEGNEYVIKNVGWNQDIAAGNSIEFGLSGDHAFKGFPENYELIGTSTEVAEDDYAIQYIVDGDWGTGFYGSISVTNNTDTALEDWVLEFDFDREITEIWNGVIEEHEGNHYVVRNAEYNSTIAPGENVSIGIKGCEGESEDEPYNYQLHSNALNRDDVDNMDSDIEIVQNAYSKIGIGYKDGDDANSVTSDLYLCTELEGAMITWSSDRPEIITDTGIVTRSAETNIVHLTATIKSNDYSMDINFEVRVVKNTYDGYNTDFIYDMDSLELLYIYNDDPNDLEVYLNDVGYIEELNGQFSEFIVESPEEAILALYEIKSLMGCENPKEQLVWEKTSKDNYGYSYKFRQVVDGVPVYGTSIVVSTDLAGITTALHSSFATDMYIDMENVISEADAKIVVENNGYNYLCSEGLVVYLANETHLTYNMKCNNEGLTYNVLIDANTGEIVFVNLLSMSENVIVETGNDVFGVNQTFHVNETTDTAGNKSYTIDDYTRNIKYHDLNGSPNHAIWPGLNIVKSTNTWTPEEISAIVSMEKVYDYYEFILGRKGFDNNRGEFHMSINLGENNSYSSGTGNNIVFGQAGGSYTVAAHAGVDTVAHEFTHAIVQNETDLELNYYDASGAINEAYADIFGYFAEGDNDPDWNHGEDNRTQPLRVLSNPNSKRMPTSVGGTYYYDFTIPGNTSDRGGVHTNNSVISYPCYLMWANGISDKARLANLWYTSLRYGYDINASFDDVRVNVLRAAKAMGMSGQEMEIIKSAFDTAGINGPTATVITGTNVLFGKVVIADVDMTAGNNTPLVGASITLTRRGTSIPIQTTSVADGTFKFYDLRPGTYILNVSKTGYLPTEQVITLTAAKMTNYCSTIELIPQKYVGVGVATGVIKDSVTGAGVDGLTLNVRRGMNTKAGELVCQITTEDSGKYELKLDAGHYCIEVVDKRTLEEGQNKYYTTYFNVKVLGGLVIENQNATVSTTLDMEQVRIVLEWGAAPRDLDSHLTGPTSNGSNFHIYFSNKSYSESGNKIADLDLDDTSSYGPETTTIYNPIEGEYVFYVYNWTGSPDIKTSGATVKVYNGNSNEPAYVFSVPLTGDGRYWTVFKYNSKTRRVTPVNIVSASVQNN